MKVEWGENTIIIKAEHSWRVMLYKIVNAAVSSDSVMHNTHNT